MDLQAFRTLVDEARDEIGVHAGDLVALYAYVGLESDGSYQLTAVTDALNAKVQAAFISGHGIARQACRKLLTDLIREHVVLDARLDPYFEVLSHLVNALSSCATSRDQGTMAGNWAVAVRAALDHVAISTWRTNDPERVYAREFAVARAARWLKDNGYAIHLAPSWIGLEETAEMKLVKKIEQLIAKIGGLNLARRIFSAISPTYDADLQRYHLIPRVSMTGGGKPQVPWGYLLQLAIKHITGKKPYTNTDTNWNRLICLITAYAAVIDVQPYVPTAFWNFHPQGLLQYIRETALYDAMFRMSQLRPFDVERLCEGILGFRDRNLPTTDGWCLGHALEIVAALFRLTPDVRGPVTITEGALCRALPHIPGVVICHVLKHVLCHPVTGANQNYSRPTDHDIDFLFRPLLRLSERRFLMIDRSVCAAACPEALLAALRPFETELDDKVGRQAERFLEAAFAARGVTVHSGDYDIGTVHGECDLIAETTERIVFFELKKKSLTRRAKAGGDVELLLDLAGSLLEAQVQAGWHEVHLRQIGSLELKRNGQSYLLVRNHREIERVAVALLDYGSFQDRIFLKHLLETTLGVNFSLAVQEPESNRRFQTINKALSKIRAQLAKLHQGESNVAQPFFHCWFLSLPQILVLLDDVTDAASFWTELLNIRHSTTGTSDFYYEFSRMKRMKAEVAAQGAIA